MTESKFDMKKQIGLTKEVGFQFGLRKTYSVASDKMWDFLFSDKGLSLWLGNIESELVLKKEFKTKEGISGFVRVLQPNSHIRLNWQRQGWTNKSLVQVRVIENNDKCTVSFHQEKLNSLDQREEMKIYWNDVMDRISNFLSGSSYELS